MHYDSVAVVQLEAAIIPWHVATDGQSQGLRQIHARRALAAAEGFLRRSPRPGPARPGNRGSAERGERHGSPGGAEDEAEREAFHGWQDQNARLFRWARRYGRLIDPRLTRRLDVNIGGVEHETFHEPISGRWVKLTWPGKAGKELHAQLEQSGVRGTLHTVDAPPAAYLTRLRLANRFLGDDICLHGIVATATGPRLVTSQRHIRGAPASPAEIARHFRTHGFQQVNEKTFYHPGENLLVSDAHSANIFRTPEGITVPFDVCLQRPSGALRMAVAPAPALDFDAPAEGEEVEAQASLRF
jgi:hypothetical protein